MSNPVLNAQTFAPAARTGQPTYVPPGYQGQPFPGQPGYGQPGQSGFSPPGYGPGAVSPGQYPPPYDPMAPPAAEERMTLDSVLTKAAFTIGGLVIVAALSWMFVPLQILMPVAVLAGLVSIICPLIVAFRRAVGPGLAFLFAALEGVFLGGLSKWFESEYEGIVAQAVVGTFVAAGVTLAAYHFGKVRVSGRVRRIVFLSLIAYGLVALLNFILSLAGINLGFYAGVAGPVSPWAWLWAGIGVVLAVITLLDDFQFIDQGIRAGAPAKQSWVAAYGLTVTMVFLYTHILRILSYIRR